ncbi:A/G-specific adenine glycosylase [Pirellulaceae bacterium SH501]
MKNWEAGELQQLRKRTKAWFQKKGRALPWRESNDPYRIWISEIMLQQTQVATVIPYFHRFLGAFPTVTSLADAPEEQVLLYWSGLGYYRRAKQLHAAAKVIRDRYNGVFPTVFEAVLALPGIGRYTAGAICSFAYDSRTPIVEANTQRLYARLLRLRGQLTEKPIQDQLWRFASSILPERAGSGAMNQSVMELGSQVCTPKEPSCSECPLRELCPTFAHGEQAEIPSPKPPKVYEDRVEAAILVQNDSRELLVRRCQPGERWAGLWDFPRFDVTTAQSAPQLHQSISEQFESRFGSSICLQEELLQIKHGVTRYRITLRCFRATMNVAANQVSEATEERDTQWCSVSNLKEIPLSSTGKRIAQHVAKQQESI